MQSKPLMYRCHIALLVLTLCTSVLLGLPAQAAEPDRPRIGLALSGGGARGAAHIGVLRELERLRIPVDYIAGTSMGAIVGGLYAAGMAPAELAETIQSIDWESIFSDRPPRSDLSMRRKLDDALFPVNKNFGIRDKKLAAPSGLIQGQKFGFVLRELLTPYAHIQDFDQFRIPFRAVAADIATGKEVVIASGSLATAIRASMAVPGVFATVHYRDKQLVDGGIANNLPVSVVRDMGADIVIAVDISTPLSEPNEIASAIAVVVQLSGFLTRRNTELQIKSLGKQDILIVPKLGKLSSADFKRAAEAIDIGAQSVTEVTGELARLSLPADRYVAYMASHKIEKAPSLPTVSFIRINNRSGMADAVIQSKIKTKPGGPLDIEVLEDDIDRLYGLDVFESVTYDLVTENGESGVVLNVHEKSWGPRYLQFGLEVSSDFDAENNFGLILGYTVTPINKRNGEWRTIFRLGDDRALITDWYQPIQASSPYFFNPQLFADSTVFNFRNDTGQIVSQRRTNRIGVELAAGREFGNRAQFRFGLRRYGGDDDLRIGTEGPENVSVSGGEVFAALRYDTLDNFYFPTRGLEGRIGWLGSRESLGAEQRFDQAKFDILGAVPIDPDNTVLLGARYFATVDGTTSTQNRFRAGGLFLIPGYNTNSLSGQNLVVLRGAYFRRLRRIEAVKTYAGFSLQTGNVFESEHDISASDFIIAGSAFIGFDTVLGPVYIGAGWNDENESAVYFSLGPRF